MKFSTKISLLVICVIASGFFYSTTSASTTVNVNHSASCDDFTSPPCPASIGTSDTTYSYINYFTSAFTGNTDGGAFVYQVNKYSNGAAIGQTQTNCLGFGPFPDLSCITSTSGDNSTGRGAAQLLSFDASIAIGSAYGLGSVFGTSEEVLCDAGYYAKNGACVASSGSIFAVLANPTCTGVCDVNVSWNVPYAGLIPFNDIYRDGSFWQHPHVSVTSATDTAKPVGTYQYCVRSYDGWGNPTGDLDCANVTVPSISAPYDPVVCSPAAGQTVQLNDPAYFTASLGSGTYTWSAPGGSPSSGSGSIFSTQYSSGGSKTVTVSDGTSSANCPVSVLVCSLTANGSSSSATITAGGTVNMVTTSNPSGKNFRWRGTDNGVAISPIAGGTTDSTDIWTLSSPATYTRYAEVESDGNLAACTTNTVTITVVPAATGPGGFVLNPPGGGSSAYCSGTNSTVSLTWSSSSGATSYTVHRSGGASFAPVNVGSALSYTDNSVVDLTTYTYYITAANGVGSLNSNSVDITTLDCSGAPLAPTISLSPSFFSFNGVQGGPTPSGQTLTIRNTGTANLNWAALATPGKPGGWCHISSFFGNLTPGASQNLSITVDAPSNVGTFSDCGIRIADSNATNNPQDITITYAVTPSGIACNSNADCGDANVCTTDTCVNPGTASSYCDNTNNPVDGGWSAWGACSGGVETRTCTNPSQACGGANCVGPNSRTCGGGPNPPGNPPAASNSVCGIITITWTAPSGGGSVNNYRVYRLNSSLGNTFADSDTVNISGNLSNATFSYQDNTPVAGAVYYYWVEAVGPGGTAYSAISGATSSAFSCSANLVSSDKDIVAINGTNIGSGVGNQCGGTDALPANTILKISDTIKFSINLCNSGAAAASAITITDTLLNLKQPTGGWNVKFDSGSGENALPSGMSYSVSGTVPNQVITFSGIPSVPAGASLPSIRRITFEAQITVPAGYTGPSARLQNRANIAYNSGNLNIATPLLPFYTGQTPPTIIEVP